MRKSDAINKIQSLYKFGSRLGLERMEVLMELLGNPQNNNVIHVAGTNGKGSTCKLVNSVLMNAGYKTRLCGGINDLIYSQRTAVAGMRMIPSEGAGLREAFRTLRRGSIEDRKSVV